MNTLGVGVDLVEVPRVSTIIADKGARVFERLLTLRNDVGLLAEEYDPQGRRQVGNYPQAFSHVALVSTAHNLASATKPAHQRAAS